MAIAFWVVFGGLAGWIVSYIVGSKGRFAVVNNVVCGMVGAMISGFFMVAVGGSGAQVLSLYSLSVAVGGAVFLLYLKTLIDER